MDFRLTIVCCIILALAVSVSAAHLEGRQRDDVESLGEAREKRDVMDTMKNAWGEVVRTLSDASDAVVHVFKPTEKSVVDKMADGVKGLVNSS